MRGWNDGASLALSRAVGLYTEAGVLGRSLILTNDAGLSRWVTARNSGNAVITCVGDSITWGVGSDGNSGETFPIDTAQQALYRANSWPAQLRAKLAANYGFTAAENFIGLQPGWGFPFTPSGVTASGTTGPFGQFASSGRGGYAMPNGTSITLDAASMGSWTTIDVYYWGTDSGISSACAPSVSIDGVAQTIPTGVRAGSLNVMTFTVASGTHAVVLSCTQPTLTSYVWGVNVRNGSGITVNRIASPGAAAKDLAGTSVAPARTRVLQSTVMPGTSNLLILSLGTNDQSQQIALADYTAKLQEVIDLQVNGGGCVLLLGEPPAAGPTGTLTESDYRNAMKSLAVGHVAYCDVRDLFGTHAQGYALGYYPTASTVHPSSKGAGVIASALASVLARG